MVPSPALSHPLSSWLTSVYLTMTYMVLSQVHWLPWSSWPVSDLAFRKRCDFENAETLRFFCAPKFVAICSAIFWRFSAISAENIFAIGKRSDVSTIAIFGTLRSPTICKRVVWVHPWGSGTTHEVEGV